MVTTGPEPARAAEPAPGIFLPSRTLSVPSEAGTLETFHEGTNGKTVFYIQDAHDSIEAQENIAEMIRHFVETRGVTLVFEEGFEGPVPTDQYFGGMTDASAREKTAWLLMDRLRIGGAEYAHITREKDFKLIGADNIRLHLENIDWYRKNAGLMKETSEDLAALQREIDILASRNFPKAMRDWMKWKKRFDNGELGLLDYLRRFDGVDSARHPSAALLLAAADTEDETILEKAKDLDAGVLFAEISDLEIRLAQKSLSGEKDRKIFRFYRGLELLVRLNEIRLTPAEYEAAAEEIRNLDTRALGEFISESKGRSLVLSRSWEENIRRAVRFYEIAAERDAAVAARLNQFLASSETSAVLVFGGFHREKIARFLKEKGFSYAVVSPKITGADPQHEKHYRSLMSAGYRPFEAAPLLAQAPMRLDILGEAQRFTPDRLARAARYPPVFVEGVVGDPARLKRELQQIYRSNGGKPEEFAALPEEPNPESGRHRPEMRTGASGEGDGESGDVLSLLLSRLGSDLDGNRLSEQVLESNDYREMLKRSYERLDFVRELIRSREYTKMRRILRSISSELPDSEAFTPARKTIQDLISYLDIFRARSELRSPAGEPEKMPAGNDSALVPPRPGRLSKAASELIRKAAAESDSKALAGLLKITSGKTAGIPAQLDDAGKLVLFIDERVADKGKTISLLLKDFARQKVFLRFQKDKDGFLWVRVYRAEGDFMIHEAFYGESEKKFLHGKEHFKARVLRGEAVPPMTFTVPITRQENNSAKNYFAFKHEGKTYNLSRSFEARYKGIAEDEDLATIYVMSKSAYGKETVFGFLDSDETDPNQAFAKWEWRFDEETGRHQFHNLYFHVPGTMNWFYNLLHRSFKAAAFHYAKLALDAKGRAAIFKGLELRLGDMFKGSASEVPSSVVIANSISEAHRLDVYTAGDKDEERGRWNPKGRHFVGPKYYDAKKNRFLRHWEEITRRHTKWASGTGGKRPASVILRTMKGKETRTGAHPTRLLLKPRGGAVYFQHHLHEDSLIMVRFAEVEKEGLRRRGIEVFALNEDFEPQSLIKRGYYDAASRRFLWFSPNKRRPLASAQAEALKDEILSLGYYPFFEQDRALEAEKRIDDFLSFLGAEGEKRRPDVDNLFARLNEIFDFLDEAKSFTLRQGWHTYALDHEYERLSAAVNDIYKLIVLPGGKAASGLAPGASVLFRGRKGRVLEYDYRSGETYVTIAFDDLARKSDPEDRQETYRFEAIREELERIAEEPKPETPPRPEVNGETKQEKQREGTTSGESRAELRAISSEQEPFDLRDIIYMESGTPDETGGEFSFLDFGARYGRQVVALTDDLRRRMGYGKAFGVGIDIAPLNENLYFSGIRPGENYVVADVTRLETQAPEVLKRGPYNAVISAAPDMENIDFKAWLAAGKRYLKEDGIFLISFVPDEDAAFRQEILEALKEEGLHYHWFSEESGPRLYGDSHKLGSVLLAKKTPLKGRYAAAGEHLRDASEAVFDYRPFFIGIPSHALFKFARRFILTHFFQLDTRILAHDFSPGTAGRILDSLVQNLKLQIMARRGPVSGRLDFFIDGWTPRWVELWEKESLRETANPYDAYRALYMAVYYARPGIDPMKGLLARLYDHDAFIRARRGDYESEGRAPPQIEFVRIPFNGAAISAYLIQPSSPGNGSGRPVVILSHGILNRKEHPYFDSLEKTLIENGIAVLRPDLPNHGEEKNIPFTAETLLPWVDALTGYIESRPALDSRRTGFFGFSFSGNVALRVLNDPARAGRFRAVSIMNAPVHDTFTGEAEKFIAQARPFFSELFGLETKPEMVQRFMDFALPEISIRSSDPSAVQVLIAGKDEYIASGDLERLRVMMLGAGLSADVFPSAGHYAAGSEKSRAFQLAGEHFIRRLSPSAFSTPALSGIPGQGSRFEMRSASSEGFERMKARLLDPNMEIKDADWKTMEESFSVNQLAILALSLDSEDRRVSSGGRVFIGKSVFETRRESVAALIKKRNTAAASASAFDGDISPRSDPRTSGSRGIIGDGDISPRSELRAFRERFTFRLNPNVPKGFVLTVGGKQFTFTYDQERPVLDERQKPLDKAFAYYVLQLFELVQQDSGEGLEEGYHQVSVRYEDGRIHVNRDSLHGKFEYQLLLETRQIAGAKDGQDIWNLYKEYFFLPAVMNERTRKEALAAYDLGKYEKSVDALKKIIRGRDTGARSELRAGNGFAQKHRDRLAGQTNGNVKLIAGLLENEPEISLQGLAAELNKDTRDADFRRDVLAYLDTFPKVNLHEHTSGLLYADYLLPYFLEDSAKGKEARRRFALTFKALSGKQKTALEVQAVPPGPDSITQEEADRIFREQVGFPGTDSESFQESVERLKNFVTYRREDRDWNAFESAFAYIKAVTDADPHARFQLAKKGALRQFREQHVRYIEVTDYHGTSIENFAESMAELVRKLLEAEQETGQELSVAALRAFRKDHVARILEEARREPALKERWLAPYRDLDYQAAQEAILAEVLDTDRKRFFIGENKIRKEFTEAVEEIERQLARDGVRDENAKKERLVLVFEARKRVYQESEQFLQGLNELERRYPLYRKRVIGVSSIGDEVDYINWVMSPLLRTAQLVGLKRSSHIGERWRPGEYVPSLQRVKREIETGVERLAHATVLGLDFDRVQDISPEDRELAKALQKEIFAEIIRNNIHVETLPTSNVRFSGAFNRYEDHVAYRFWKEGIGFSVHPDDSSVFDTTPTQEIAQLWFANPELPYEQLVLTVDQAYSAKFYHPVRETIDRLKREVQLVLEIHKQYPPKVGVYGSARIPPAHPQAVMAHQLGRELWKRRVAPMTGAGPGIMRYIVEGYLEAMLEEMDTVKRTHPGFDFEPHYTLVPLGIRILLNKFEPTTELDHFPVYNFRHFGLRKLALHVNILELISMHGGLGSMDEIFEALRRGRNVTLWDSGHILWKRIFETLDKMFLEHGLRERIIHWPLITTEIDEALEGIMDPVRQRNYIPQIDEKDAAAIETEVEEALYKLGAQPRAVAIIGRPAEGAAETALLREITAGLLGHGVTVRPASRGPVTETVLEVSRRKEIHRENLVQTVLYKPKRSREDWTPAEKAHAGNFPDQSVHLSTSSGHQIASGYDARAYLVLPGTWGTFNKLFDILVSMQTGTIRRKPIVLIGRKFWQPFLDVLHETMEEYDPPLLSMGDIEIMKIADTAEEAIGLLRVNGFDHSAQDAAASARFEMRPNADTLEQQSDFETGRFEMRSFNNPDLAEVVEAAYEIHRFLDETADGGKTQKGWVRSFFETFLAGAGDAEEENLRMAAGVFHKRRRYERLLKEWTADDAFAFSKVEQFYGALDRLIKPSEVFLGDRSLLPLLAIVEEIMAAVRLFAGGRNLSAGELTDLERELEETGKAAGGGVSGQIKFAQNLTGFLRAVSRKPADGGAANLFYGNVVRAEDQGFIRWSQEMQPLLRAELEKRGLWNDEAQKDLLYELDRLTDEILKLKPDTGGEEGLSAAGLRARLEELRRGLAKRGSLRKIYDGIAPDEQIEFLSLLLDFIEAVEREPLDAGGAEEALAAIRGHTAMGESHPYTRKVLLPRLIRILEGRSEMRTALELTPEEKRKLTPKYRGAEAIAFLNNYPAWRAANPDKKLLILARHVEATSNLFNYNQSDLSFSPPTLRGIRQGRYLTRFLRGTGIAFDRVISSALERAYFTVHGVARGQSLRHEVFKRLNELMGHPMSGISRSIMEDLYKTFIVYLNQDPLKFELPGFSGAYRLKYLEDLFLSLGDKEQKNILVGSHGLTKRWLLEIMLGIPYQKDAGVINLIGGSPNVGITALAYDPQTKSWELLTLYENSYLPDSLREGKRNALWYAVERFSFYFRAAGRVSLRLIGMAGPAGISDYQPFLVPFLPPTKIQEEIIRSTYRRTFHIIQRLYEESAETAGLPPAEKKDAPAPERFPLSEEGDEQRSEMRSPQEPEKTALEGSLSAAKRLASKLGRKELFFTATGFESSITWIPEHAGPGGEIIPGHYVNLYESLGHSTRLREDVRLAKSVQARIVRTHFDILKVWKGPGDYDWSSLDELFDVFESEDMVPALDLLHFGLPEWLLKDDGKVVGFQNERIPEEFARFTRDFMARYKNRVEIITPVNEPIITVLFSTHLGFWNEAKKDDEGFARALRNVMKAAVLSTAEIRKADPEVILLQNDSAEYFHSREDGRFRADSDFYNDRRFITLDLLYGVPLSPYIRGEILLKHGWKETELKLFAGESISAAERKELLTAGWTEYEISTFEGFLPAARKENAILGLDYYAWNEHYFDDAGAMRAHNPSNPEDLGRLRGFTALAGEYYGRYGMPLMIAETHRPLTANRGLWMDALKKWTRELLEQGVPLIGSTWYSLIHQRGWGAQKPLYDDEEFDVGIFDLDRSPVQRYLEPYMEMVGDMRKAAGRRSELRLAEPEKMNVRDIITLQDEVVFAIAAEAIETLSRSEAGSAGYDQWAELLGLKLLNPEKLHLVILEGNETTLGKRTKELLTGRHFGHVHLGWSGRVPKDAVVIQFISPASAPAREGTAMSSIFDGAFLQALKLSFDPDRLKELTANGLKKIDGLVLPGIADLLDSFFQRYVVIARSA